MFSTKGPFCDQKNCHVKQFSYYPVTYYQGSPVKISNKCAEYKRSNSTSNAIHIVPEGLASLEVVTIKTDS